MSEKPIFGHRVAEGQKTELLEDYVGALRSIRAARGVFLLTLILSLLVHIGAYCAVRWGGVLGSHQEARTGVSEPAEDVSSTAPAVAELRNSSIWRPTMQLTLPLAEFLGQVSCALLAVSFLFAASICLSGGLGGVRGGVSAFFWTLVVLALLFPWGRWLGDATGMLQVPGVYSTFDELLIIPSTFRDRVHEVLHYARFLGYPALALIILLVGDARFARGYRLVQAQLETRLGSRI